MKRNRVKYVVYFGADDDNQGYTTVYSKFQAKKLLAKAVMGSYFTKNRLIWYKTGGYSWWNTDRTYPFWEKVK